LEEEEKPSMKIEVKEEKPSIKKEVKEEKPRMKKEVKEEKLSQGGRTLRPSQKERENQEN
jgi:hypothetical protein